MDDENLSICLSVLLLRRLTQVVIFSKLAVNRRFSSSRSQLISQRISNYLGSFLFLLSRFKKIIGAESE